MIDTHCHIDLYPDPEKLLQKLDEEGLTVIGMTNLPSHFEIGHPRVKHFRRIRLALGMHPLNAADHASEFQKFDRLNHLTSYIGEIGLDFSDLGLHSREIQVDSLCRILGSLADEKKIFSLHSRNAESEVLRLLVKYQIKSGIFHWYSGPLKLIDLIADQGYYFSINPAMIRSKSGRARIGRIPKAKVLTETDGPFVEIRGIPAEPGDVKWVIAYLSKSWNCDYLEADKIIRSNFNTLLTGLR